MADELWLYHTLPIDGLCSHAQISAMRKTVQQKLQDKELMGHKSIEMTLKYAHLSQEYQIDAVQKLIKIPTDTKTDTRQGIAEKRDEVEASISSDNDNKVIRLMTMPRQESKTSYNIMI